MDLLSVFLLFNGLSLQTIYACEMYRFEVSDESKALQGHVIKTMSASHVSLCWNDCVWLPWCFSINVRQTSEGQSECELNNSSKTADLSKLVTKQGWTYHEMKDVDGPNCKLHDCKRKEDLGDGWYRYGNASIKLFTDKKNWTAARSHCQSLGGDLLSITSSHENDFIYDVFVQNLNLTYMQEDNGLPLKVFKHFKLNGEELDVTLLGTPGDAVYKQDGREKALYLNGRKGCAQLSTIPIGSSSKPFTLSFWMKTANHTQQWTTPINIYGNLYPSIVLIKLGSASNYIYFNVRNGNSFDPYGPKKLPLNEWSFHTFSWVDGTNTMNFGYQGTFYKTEINKVTSIVLNSNAKWVIGAKNKEELSTQDAFHGYLKHVIVSTNIALNEHEVQTTMYWHEQGVWIGLNALSGTNLFSWSDGSPVSFKNLPSYNPLPVKSGRKCVGIGKDHLWLDKLCHLKYPYLCEKPAPP